MSAPLLRRVSNMLRQLTLSGWRSPTNHTTRSDMDTQTLERIIAAHRAWLRGEADGCRADLRGADLREANLCWTDLREADLREADLRGADLREADL